MDQHERMHPFVASPLLEVPSVKILHIDVPLVASIWIYGQAKGQWDHRWTWQ